MKNSKSKVLMTSVIMLVVAVLALSTATYAWFIQATQGQFSGITMTSESSSGLRFTNDGTNWKNTFTLATDYGIAADAVYAPVSGYFDENNVLSFFKGEYNKDTGNLDIAADTTNYVAFSFYVAYDGALAGESWALTVEEAAVTTDSALDVAIRVAFIFNGASGEAPDPVAEDKTHYDPNFKGTWYLWSPNAGLEAQSDSYYALTGTGTGLAADLNKGGGYVLDKTSGLVADDETTSTKVNQGIVDQEIFAKQSVQYVQVTVVIWIEGQ
ncbi:MAG: hypothetical protein J6R37_03640, partial [Clostridia bacterium]|nr:hypothetical protein [Clostridia bacterium]